LPAAFAAQAGFPLSLRTKKLAKHFFCHRLREQEALEIAAETVQNFALLFGLDTFGRGAGHAATGLVKGSGEGTLSIVP
jgi:hypothetical protein